MANDSIRELIEKSGHDLAFRTKKILENAGWRAEVSRYYTDTVTGKPREIDVVAKKEWSASGDFFGKTTTKLTARLYIECKHVKESIVFWMSQKKMDDAKKLAKNNSILRHKEDHYLTYTAGAPHLTHHYIESEKAAKNWSKSGNSDPIYDGMNGCIHSQLFFEGLPGDGPYVVDFPIILIEPENKVELVEKTEDDTSYSLITEGTQLEIDYAFLNVEGKGQTHYALVDVVQLSSLAEFLKKIEDNDIAILKRLLAWDLTQARQEAVFDGYNPDPFY